MSYYDCERCGADESQRFVHFDQRDDEFLCFDCRWPFLKERIHGEEESIESKEEGDTEDEVSGQTGLSDFT
jgi:hypothetical protein